MKGSFGFLGSRGLGLGCALPCFFGIVASSRGSPTFVFAYSLMGVEYRSLKNQCCNNTPAEPYAALYSKVPGLRT